MAVDPANNPDNKNAADVEVGSFSYFREGFADTNLGFWDKLGALFTMFIPGIKWHKLDGISGLSLDHTARHPEEEFSFKHIPLPHFDMDRRILDTAMHSPSAFEALRYNKLQPTEAFNRAAENLTPEDIVEANLLIAEATADELTEDEIKYGGKLEAASKALNTQFAKSSSGETAPEPGVTLTHNLTLNS